MASKNNVSVEAHQSAIDQESLRRFLTEESTGDPLALLDREETETIQESQAFLSCC